MWTYLIRRLLLMIPTLFGITIVSFLIMQMAPGDPLLNQLGAEGAQGRSTTTREAYLIQKRDLKLDKPLLINLRVFTDYRPPMLQAAHFQAQSLEELRGELAQMRSDPASFGPALRFLEKLGIDNFHTRLANPDQHLRLAEAIKGHLQIFCEDVGQYAVPAAIQLLIDEETTPRQKIGLIDCLRFMVVEPHQYTYSRNPSEEETPLVAAPWVTWWERAQDELPPVSDERRTVLAEQLQTMVEADSRARLFELIRDEFLYDRSDMPFFVNVLLDQSPLRQKVVAAAILKLYIANPLQMELAHAAPDGTASPLQRRPVADAETVERVTENWLTHYLPRRDYYDPSLPVKLWRVVADTQYAHMVWRLVTFDFGRSALKTKEPVSGKLWRAFLVSAPLMLMAQLVIYVISIPAGILCAVNRNNWIDRSLSLLLFLLYSIPPFVAGMMFLLFLCYGEYWDVFPMERLHSPGAQNYDWPRYLLDYLWHATLPVICLSLFSLAAMAMYSRTSMLDVISHDYIRTARAKGLPWRTVIFKHAFRNALIPILTLFSNFLPALLGGSVIIEYLFNIPGMGRLAWESIEQKDIPTVMALIYVDAIVVLLSILLTDILYVFVDPRISFGGHGRTT